MADLQSKPSGMSTEGDDDSHRDQSPGSGMSPEGDDEMADLQSKPSGMSPEGDDENVSENYIFLPMCNIIRIMKRRLPPNAHISKDAKETMQECVSEFISVITSEAAAMCKRVTRQTIKGDDLLWSMTTLGLEQYAEPLKIYLQRYREFESGVQPNQVPQVSQPAYQSSGSQVPNENSQDSQPDHQSSSSQVPDENSQVSQPTHQSSGSQVPNEHSQVSQPADQSSVLQVPNENSQVSQPAQQSWFSQAPNETPQDPNMIVPMPCPEY